MRKGLSVALVAGLLGTVGMARQAEATVTIALEWGECGGGAGCTTATGTDTIGVEIGGGQTLRLDVYLSHDLTSGLVYQSFSLNFDTDLANELNLGPMAQMEWAGTDAVVSTYAPLSAGVTTAESTGALPGRINSFESGSMTGVLPANGVAYTVGTFTATAPARYRVGLAFFTVNGASADGPDIFAGLFNLGVDGFIDGNLDEVPPGSIVLGAATVNLAPEPGTASLLGLGLVGLFLTNRIRRRRRSSIRP